MPIWHYTEIMVGDIRPDYANIVKINYDDIENIACPTLGLYL